MSEVQRVFGEQVNGHTYHARRAVYAVIADSAGGAVFPCESCLGRPEPS